MKKKRSPGPYFHADLKVHPKFGPVAVMIFKQELSRNAFRKKMRLLMRDAIRANRAALVVLEDTAQSDFAKKNLTRRFFSHTDFGFLCPMQTAQKSFLPRAD